VSDEKCFEKLTSLVIFGTVLHCTNSSTKSVSMSKLYNSTIKKTTTENQIGIIENTINNNKRSTNKKYKNDVRFKSCTKLEHPTYFFSNNN
jgi:hypothetical protein